MRRVATQVSSAVSRLYAAGLVKTPPTWYLPVINNPPPILPARQAVLRRRLPNPLDSGMPERGSSSDDLALWSMRKAMREVKPRARGIVYPEDRIRRQFFLDFPFEALRPTTLVEGREIRDPPTVQGKSWIRLEQRSLYPSPEDVVDFTISIHTHHDRPMSEAYTIATTEFAQLRAAHEMATIAAEMEAMAYGAKFTKSPFIRAFNKEGKALDTLAPKLVLDAASRKPKYRKPKKWTAAALDLHNPEVLGGFTGGTAYIQKWKIPPRTLPAELADTAAAKGASEKSGAREEEMDDDELVRANLPPLGRR